MKLSIFNYQNRPGPGEEAQAKSAALVEKEARRMVWRFTLYGVLSGLVFVLAATLIQISQARLPLALWSVLLVYQDNPLQWMISTAPVVLGILAYLIGRRQARILQLIEELRIGLDERSALVSRLEGLSASLQQEAERQLVQLKTAAQVAQEGNALIEPDQLLSQTVKLVSERFGFYHVGIFLHDDKNEYTVLKAANSEGGQQMLRGGHRLKIGEVGIVGYVAQSGTARIALDVGSDAVFFNNPDLPETRSEIALPIKTLGKTFGVLDIQSTKTGAFDENDAVTLQIIADSLASAIENARLFAEQQASLDEIRTLHHQYLEQSWSDVQAKRGTLEYTYQGTTDTPESAGRALQAPIRLRDQVIGNLELEADNPSQGADGNEWSPEEMTLIQAVTDQLALSLENARLLEQVQKKASQEELINRIVSSAQSSLSIETVMRSAVEGIGRGMNVSRVRLRLGEAAQAEETSHPDEPAQQAETQPAEEINQEENPVESIEDNLLGTYPEAGNSELISSDLSDFVTGLLRGDESMAKADSNVEDVAPDSSREDLRDEEAGQ
jgi:GAF domain-containing protein